MLYTLAKLPASSLGATHLHGELKALAERIAPRVQAGEFVQAKPWSNSLKEQLILRVRLSYVQAHRHFLSEEQLARLPEELAVAEETVSRRRAEARQRQIQAQVRARAEQARASARKMLHALALQHHVGPDHLPLAFFEELQKDEARKLFRVAYGKDPSPEELRQVFNLTEEVYRSLADIYRKRGRLEREKREAQRKFESELIPGAVVQSRLKITEAEYAAWTTMGRLPVAKTKTFRKWGQMKTVQYHHPSQLAHATPEQIAAWRQEDLKRLSPGAQRARLRSIERLTVREQLAEVLRNLYPEAQVKDLPRWQLGWNRREQLLVEVPSRAGSAGDVQSELWPVSFELQIRLPVPKTRAAVKALVSEVNRQFRSDVLVRHQKRLRDGIADFLATYESALPEECRSFLRNALKERLAAGISQVHTDLNSNITGLLGRSIANILREIDKQRASTLLRLADYPQAFPLARSLSREVRLMLGPTNSGKTHEALRALTGARSGVYLAPLRLLAMEVRDRLVAEGIPCNLITGEERELMPGAQHTACTVEMLDTTSEVEVAVIDEIQMLADPQRGWAWSRALLGTPARTIYVCGASNARDLCVRTLEALGESYSVTMLERKTPLIVEPKPLCRGNTSRVFSPTPEQGILQRGDAVIAFSRKDVLTLSARFRNTGFRVATIYGSLAPEVRRTEAHRFASGEADILVATDAIGMGLNLPIRRVIFSTVRKFDGVSHRRLTAAEIQQIAGRAGRFGRYPEGLVTAIDEADLAYIREHLAQPIPSLTGRLSIAPDFWHIEALAQLLKTKSIGALLSFFSSQLHVDSVLFETASMADSIALGHEVDCLAPDVPLADKFVFACAPVCPDKPEELAYFRTCVQAFVKGQRLRAPSVEERLRDFVPHGNAYLQAAEQLSKDASLYAWLSFKYPAIFDDTETLAEVRSVTSRRIESTLLTQSGFRFTSRESFDSMRWDY